MIRLKTYITPSKGIKELIDKISKLPEKDYTVFVADDKRSRTLTQNKYYWGVVLPIIAGHTGHTKEEIHEICKFKFNKHIIVDPETGEIMEIGKTTTGLKIQEFINFIDTVKIWATELGCYIPEAGEVPDEVAIIHDLGRT